MTSMTSQWKKGWRGDHDNTRTVKAEWGEPDIVLNMH